MGLSSQLDLIRSLLLRFHVLSKQKRRRRSRHAVGCVGRLRSLSIPTLSSLRSWREEAPEKRRRRRRKTDQESADISEVFVSPDGIPSEEEEYARFSAMHPGYLETLVVDELRDEEYGELQEDGHVCLDYSGHGLFSQLQQELDSDSSSFAISHISGDLSTQALYCEPDEGTVECDIRRRVMRFLNIQEGEYSMVFTSSKGSAFKLLAESYPFDAQRSLLTMFDYESEAVGWMEETARRHGAQTLNASFNFPSLSVCSTDLKSQILYKKEEKINTKGKDLEITEIWEAKSKKKKRKTEEYDRIESKKEDNGLFVFPVQSRVTGTKYSYQWMSLAQDNGWHVLLDASALGPKDMDSLGISLFRPDFIVTSFYKVFGSDPTGFGCLFVKNASMSILSQSATARSIGMVRLIPFPGVSSVNDMSCQEHDNACKSESKGKNLNETKHRKEQPGQAEVAFSGPVNFFRWRPSSGAGSLRLGDCLEKENEESASWNLPNNVIESQTYVKQVSEGGTEELQKDKVPITPRSVLEERLLGGVDHSHSSESHELDESNTMQLEQNRHSEPSEVSFKQNVSSEIESLHNSPLTSLSNCISQTSPHKKRYLTYHSHEIARNASSFLSQSAFSQPLFSRDLKQGSFIAHSEGSSYYAGSQEELEFSSSLYDEDDQSSEFDIDDDISIARREPEIYCRGLNHADTLGLNKTNDRLRFLTNWLISSLLKLHHLVSNKFLPLVLLYGPKVKYDRGASVAFNLFDCNGDLIRPLLVQQLADRNKISLGLGVLSHVRSLEIQADLAGGDTSDTMLQNGSSLRFQVVTASLGFFTNFEDVYRLWGFIAKFLDADFVQQEQVVLEQ